MERNDAMSYYDGTKLLSMKDLEGNEPEIYLCTTNRTGGKTTYFSRMLVNKFLQNKEKFGLIIRTFFILIFRLSIFSRVSHGGRRHSRFLFK